MLRTGTQTDPPCPGQRPQFESRRWGLGKTQCNQLVRMALTVRQHDFDSRRLNLTPEPLRFVQHFCWGQDSQGGSANCMREEKYYARHTSAIPHERRQSGPHAFRLRRNLRSGLVTRWVPNERVQVKPSSLFQASPGAPGMTEQANEPAPSDVTEYVDWRQFIRGGGIAVAYLPSWDASSVRL